MSHPPPPTIIGVAIPNEETNTEITVTKNTKSVIIFSIITNFGPIALKKKNEEKMKGEKRQKRPLKTRRKCKILMNHIIKSKDRINLKN